MSERIYVYTYDTHVRACVEVLKGMIGCFGLSPECNLYSLCMFRYSSLPLYGEETHLSYYIYIL